MDEDDVIAGMRGGQHAWGLRLFYEAHPIERLFWLVLALALLGLIAAIILYAEPY